MKKRLFFIIFMTLFCSTMFGQNFTPKYEYQNNGTYPEPMSLLAKISFDGVIQNNPNLELGVFCDEELRGGCFLSDFFGTGENVAMISVYGKSGQKFTFKVYDHTSGVESEKEWTISSRFISGSGESEHMSYNADGYVDPINPAVINFVTPNHWTPNTFDSQFNFNVIAVVMKDGVEQTDTNLELGVFDTDGDVRGSVKLISQTILGNTRYYADMLVPGSVGEEITFRLYDHGIGQEFSFNDVNSCVLTEEKDESGNPKIGSYIKPLEVNFITAPYVAQIGDTKFTSLANAVEAATAGNTIEIIADISNETVVVNKNLTITKAENVDVTLSNVAINANGADELTVSNLSFIGNSWINSGTAEKLTVSGVNAIVTPSNTAQTNSRSAFISLGSSEQQTLELAVTNCNIVANGGGDAILGWATITKANLTGNTFGSSEAYQTNSDCVKFMAIANGAEFNITGNTIYSNYNGIVFGQNTTRDNAYTVNVSDNNFYGNADHIWLEVSGTTTCHATVKATSVNKVNGNAFTANDIKTHPNITTWTSYGGVDVVFDGEGKVLGGSFKYIADAVIADGYEASQNTDGTYSIVKKLSGEIAYRAYVTDTESVEALSVDLANVYASSSLKVELYSGSELLVTTEYAKEDFPIGADAFTCFMILSGTADEYWNTTINAEELTVENLPTTIKLYVDSELVDTFENALGAGTNVDETAKYKALDCVYDYKVAKVGNKEYWNIDNAIANWTNNTTLTLLSDVTLSDVITLKSTEYHILDLGSFTMTAASGKDAIQIENQGRSNAGYALDIKADASNTGGITATNKAIVRTTGKSGVKDRPIISFYNGVFNASYIVYHSGGNGTNCPQFRFHDGVFNGTIYTNRALNQFYGGTFNGSLMMSVDTSAYTLISSGKFKQLSNLFMSALNSNKFTIGSAKGVYDREVYMDDDGYYVIAVSEPAEGIEAEVAKTPGTNDYLKYSKVGVEGFLNYTDVTLALNQNKTGEITLNVDELDMISSEFKGTLVIKKDDLTVTFSEGTTPAWSVAAKEDGKIVVYTDVIENGIVKRTYSVIVPVAKIGDDKFFASLEDAIAAATEICTIDLLADVEISNTLSFSFNSAFDKINVIFNGNGKTIKAVGTAWDENTWLADIAWNVTLADVTFDGNNTGCRGLQFYTSTSTLNDITVKNITADKWGITDYAIHANASELTVTGSLTFTDCKHGMLMVDLGSQTGKEASVVSVDPDATVTGVKVILNHKDASLKAPESAANYVSMGDVPGYTMVYENGSFILVKIESQSIVFGERWNWFSHYVVGNTDSDILDQLKNELGEHGIQIKNQEQFIDYGTNSSTNATGWWGDLKSTSVKEMYKVNTSLENPNTITVVLEGVIVNPESYPITLNANWNYIGYPLSESVSVKTAFASVAKDGDYVKSQDEFAEYYNGNWHGNLKTMTPGEGYMYRNIESGESDVTKTLTYSYPRAAETTEANITAENNHWVPVSSQYADNMTMIAMLDVKGEDYEVAAFVGGEVRGSARATYVEPLDAYMFFMTVHGEEVEEMTFKCYDLTTGEELELNNRVNYSSDAVLGSIKEPYMLSFGVLSVDEMSSNAISIYPNPTTTGREINLAAKCDTVEVFNALGVKVAEYQNVDTIDAIETAGIYVIRVTNNGNVQNCRLIVR